MLINGAPSLLLVLLLLVVIVIKIVAPKEDGSVVGTKF
jgi:hypothetical protein